jgi:hypothetical protein
MRAGVNGRGRAGTEEELHNFALGYGDETSYIALGPHARKASSRLSDTQVED